MSQCTEMSESMGQGANILEICEIEMLPGMFFFQDSGSFIILTR